jgi:transposase
MMPRKYQTRRRTTKGRTGDRQRATVSFDQILGTLNRIWTRLPAPPLREEGKPGRHPVDNRLVFARLLFSLYTGMAIRKDLKDRRLATSALTIVRLRHWRKNGTLVKLWLAYLRQIPAAELRSWRKAVLQPRAEADAMHRRSVMDPELAIILAEVAMQRLGPRYAKAARR